MWYLRNVVLCAVVVRPVWVGRKKSLRLIRDVYQREGELFVGTQKEPKVEDPKFDDLYPVGTVARIIRILEMPDGSTTESLKGKKRDKRSGWVRDTPYMHAKVEMIEDGRTAENDRVFVALLEAIKELAMKIVKNSGSVPDEASVAIRNIEQPQAMINFICTNFGLKLTEKMRLLELDDVNERGFQLLDILTKESQLLEIKASIQNKARLDMDQQQREYYLQQQMKTIQEELGGSVADQELKSIKKKAEGKKWVEKVKEVFVTEYKKL